MFDETYRKRRDTAKRRDVITVAISFQCLFFRYGLRAHRSKECQLLASTFCCCLFFSAKAKGHRRAIPKLWQHVASRRIKRRWSLPYNHVCAEVNAVCGSVGLSEFSSCLDGIRDWYTRLCTNGTLVYIASIAGVDFTQIAATDWFPWQCPMVTVVIMIHFIWVYRIWSK